MKHVFLSFGSNLGNSKDNILKAYQKVIALSFVFNPIRSSIYQTSPVSKRTQNDFINMVCKFDANLDDPYLLLKETQRIEEELGKVEKPKDAPRIIDIDILLFKELYLEDPRLELPHPRMLERLFVLEPLLSIQSGIEYPTSSQNVEHVNLKSLLENFENKNNERVKELFSDNKI